MSNVFDKILDLKEIVNISAEKSLYNILIEKF